MFLSRISLPVDICHVAHCFQRIERDSHREHHFRHGKRSAELAEKDIGVLRDKVIVVDIEQNAQQNKDSQSEYPYSFLLKVLFDCLFLFSVSTFRLLRSALLADLIHPKTDLPCKRCGRHEQQDQILTKRDIQRIAGDEQNSPPGFARYQLINDQNKR